MWVVKIEITCMPVSRAVLKTDDGLIIQPWGSSSSSSTLVIILDMVNSGLLNKDKYKHKPKEAIRAPQMLIPGQRDSRDIP